jgi:hypothetical protein
VHPSTRCGARIPSTRRSSRCRKFCSTRWRSPRQATASLWRPPRRRWCCRWGSWSASCAPARRGRLRRVRDLRARVRAGLRACVRACLHDTPRLYSIGIRLNHEMCAPRVPLLAGSGRRRRRRSAGASAKKGTPQRQRLGQRLSAILQLAATTEHVRNAEMYYLCAILCNLHVQPYHGTDPFDIAQQTTLSRCRCRCHCRRHPNRFVRVHSSRARSVAQS